MNDIMRVLPFFPGNILAGLFAGIAHAHASGGMAPGLVRAPFFGRSVARLRAAEPGRPASSRLEAGTRWS